MSGNYPAGCDIITAALEKVLQADMKFFGRAEKSKLFYSPAIAAKIIMGMRL